MKSLPAGIVLSLAIAAPSWACGTERWPVKVMTDADANRVILTAEDATIHDLTALQAPPNPDAYRSKRFPAELQAYRIHATMTLIKREADQDYHIVLSDSAGETMIVESPDPQCAEGSKAAAEITAVRSAIDAKLGSITRPLHLHLPVTVNGVLFFDKIHGQTGVAKNGVELHPLLSIEWR